jgi:hypothetical protein
LWKERNRWTFDRISKTPQQLFLLIVDEADTWIAAGFASLSSLLVARAI